MYSMTGKKDRIKRKEEKKESKTRKKERTME
jgi:hypothetical protein